MKQGNYEAAIKDFSEVIRLDPKSAIAYSSRGGAQFKAANYDAAIKDLTEAIDLNPKFADAYGARGAAWAGKGDYDAALEDLTEAIRLNPKLAAAYGDRGRVRCQKRDYEGAVKDLGERIRLDPKSANAHNSLAWLYATCPDASSRDGKKAVELATKCCELSGWKAWGDVDTLAAAYAEAGDWENAVKRQEQAIELAQDEKDKQKAREHLALYTQKKPYRQQPVEVKAASREAPPAATRKQ